MLRIISSTDTDLFVPIIQSFLTTNPNVSIEYLVTGTADLDTRFRDAPNRFDIAISSAMDLQLKLANDGYAMTFNDVTHPTWANWRQSLFAFTSEPAAIVINQCDGVFMLLGGHARQLRANAATKRLVVQTSR